MGKSIEEICDRVAENRKVVQKAGFGQMGILRSASAAMIACAGQDADLDKIKECKSILRSNQGVFSDFRGYSEQMIYCKMSVKKNPEKYLADASKTYKILKEGKFFTSEIMALAAMSIVDTGRVDEAEEIALKTKELLKEMRERHPFLVDSSDTAYAALLAMKDSSIPQIVEDVEACYEILKDTFPLHKDSVYSLCQVLTLYDGTPKEKCEHAMNLYDGFKNSKVRYGKEHELAFLGVLSNLDVPDKTIIRDVINACNTIKRRRGFSFVYMDKQTRLMFGSMITAYKYSGGENDTASTVSSAISMAIVQEIMLMIMFTAVTTSASAANSASH